MAQARVEKLTSGGVDEPQERSGVGRRLPHREGIVREICRNLFMPYITFSHSVERPLTAAQQNVQLHGDNPYPGRARDHDRVGPRGMGLPDPQMPPGPPRRQRPKTRRECTSSPGATSSVGTAERTSSIARIQALIKSTLASTVTAVQPRRYSCRGG